MCTFGNHLTRVSCADLLEKSRVVTQSAGERTFHAPYQLLKGADAKLKEELFLGSLSSYNFISSDRFDLEEIDDELEWENTNEALSIYGMSEDDKKNIWRVVAGVLMFGQLEFEQGRRGSEQATVRATEH